MRRNHHAVDGNAGAPCKGGGAAQGLPHDGHRLRVGARAPQLGPVVIVAMNAERQLRGPFAKEANGARVREACVERNHGDGQVVAVYACRVAQQFGVVEVAVAWAAQVGIVDDERGVQRRRRWAPARRELVQEVHEREQREAAAGAQALAQRLAGTQLSGGAGNPLAAVDAVSVMGAVSVEHPRRGMVERGEHGLTRADAG